MSVRNVLKLQLFGRDRNGIGATVCLVLHDIYHNWVLQQSSATDSLRFSCSRDSFPVVHLCSAKLLNK